LQPAPGAGAFPALRPSRSGGVAPGIDSVRSGSWIGFLELESLLDQVAILGQFADERIDLPQGQRGLLAALQITPHELILAHAQFQRCFAGLVASRTAVLLGKREHAHDAANAGLGLAMVDRVADGADVGAGLVSPRQQLMGMRRRAPGAVLITDTMSTTLLPQMLAQQLAGARIDQSYIHRVPLHVEPAPDPARRRAIISCLNLNT